MANQKRLPLALTGYGLPHVLGYLPTRDGQHHPTPLSLEGLMDTACGLGLAAIEIPLAAAAIAAPEALRDALQTRELRLVPDYLTVLDAEVEEFRQFLQAANILGAKVVRMTLSHLLCGDRRSFPGGWDAHLAAVASRINKLLPYAQELGLCIAVENHQDATSADLLRLAEMTGHNPAYGVTLDTGNPLAVGEGPVEFAHRVAHLIRHIHLKDYTIHFAPEGYRLVRCAAGDGVVDFPVILQIISGNGHDLLPGIEIAAQATRTIPLLELDWWEHYPPTSATQLIPALQLLWAKGRPQNEPYSSAWERGEDSVTVSAEEWDIVRRSVGYFRTTTGH